MTPFNNPQLKLAYEFVQFTGKNIFLTGKAGTGKTTFLHNLKKVGNKRMIVVAPTGVAAINAGGVTIHSFFQLPFGPQIPGNSSMDYRQTDQSKIRRFSKDKINIIRSIDLLVIDEISMVRADLLDGIDSTLRRFRDRNLPFGGVQLLLIGDLQQLAPVVKENEWNLLRGYYETAFFFSSKALQETKYVSIELRHVYRQSDEEFIKLLNRVRDNLIDNEVIDALNARYNPEFDSSNTGHIILTTHNAKARDINESRLIGLDGKPHHYQASTTGNFPEFAYPTDYKLTLKNGSQVMFIKNDPNPEKRYFNGKIGTITEISNNSITVECVDDEEPISVEKLFWEKVKYTLDEKSKEIKESIEGTFVQYPLKLAWAITIHKSQGLTFENAIIDAQSAFAHGQVYVALSRCKTLEGLVLSSKIHAKSVVNDTTVNSFTKDVEENQPGEMELNESKKQFQKDLLLNLFDFVSLQRLVNYSIKLFQEHFASVLNNPINEFTSGNNIISNEIVLISNKFKGQLEMMCSENGNIEENLQLQERIKKASPYFIEKLKSALETTLNEFILETDNKVTRKYINNVLGNINHEYAYKLGCLTACINGFNTEEYLKAKALASITETSSPSKRKVPKMEATGDEQPELYRILKAWRDAKADELDWQVYRVIQLKTMREICKRLPTNPVALSLITGMGKVKMELFSNELLEIVIDYCGEYKKTSPVDEDEKVPTKKPKEDTKEVTLKLWKEGRSIEKIANERGFVVSTIEKHLTHFVRNGQLPVSELIEQEKLDQISDYFLNHPASTTTEIKEGLNNLYTYSELRFVLNHLIFTGEIIKDSIIN